MRTRDWRRFKEDQKVIKRLKNRVSQSNWGTINANDQHMRQYRWMSMIGTSTHFMYKGYTCKSVDSKWNEKWGQKGKGKFPSDRHQNCRINDKRLFKKMLQDDYGIKHFNISYGFI